ncbi:hypothetical protein COCSADRAFT_263559 [Bipolaris sorokiniana ND90Pr]|uniref:Uncharacterized protein n=1 Tax=Cochliobolus sativus (strain ND90Pr / ATCC 201652) TaxID=665912 RepID=M2QTM4_COCSN|nr:uncharacterized protein COCSADRAFT_263559 [Bipolaris sorokiniana ND90Pr]EMD58519.1 hypothetical protein COCSADRAFT_263559 [Bipolaris sorokiniana ND90Pr]
MHSAHCVFHHSEPPFRPLFSGPFLHLSNLQYFTIALFASLACISCIPAFLHSWCFLSGFLSSYFHVTTILWLSMMRGISSISCLGLDFALLAFGHFSSPCSISCFHAVCPA